MIVYELTNEQSLMIQGHQYMDDSFFWWVYDGHGRRIITEQQVSQCVNSDFQWVKDLPKIEWVEPPPPNS